MGLQAVPGFLGNETIQHPDELFRNLVAAIGGGRTGAFRPFDFELTPSGSAMQMNIAPGWAMIMGNGANTQGGYFVWSNAAEDLAWPAAAGSPRIDSLVLRVIDTEYGADPATPQAMWEVVSGTPASSPVEVPDVEFEPGGDHYRPGAYWRVANHRVNNGDTNLAQGSLTPKYLWARTGRHTIAKANQYPADAAYGDLVTDYDTENLYHRSNGVWVPVSHRAVFKAAHLSVISITHNTNFAIPWTDAEVQIDTHGFHTSLTPTRVTPDVPGYYRFTGTINLAGRTDFTQFAIGFRKNGATMIAPWTREIPTTTSLARAIPVSTVIECNGSTDYVEFMVHQSNGASAAANTNVATQYTTALDCEWIGPLI